MSNGQSTTAVTGGGSGPELERLADLERRSLLAEQARQLAHDIRTPLSVIDLICETMQLELQEDKDKIERIGQVLSASAKVSGALSDALRRTRFSDGAQRPIDAVEAAARLTLQHGGRVDESSEAAAADCRILADPDAFEAAVVHGLRLIGGVESSPMLTVSIDQGIVRLRLSSSAVAAEGVQAERDDRRLMLQAIERLARDCGGKVQHEITSLLLELPVYVDREADTVIGA